MNECLKALRVENGLTQQQLAEILNISNKNIWTYEKGIATPPPSVLVGYAKYFNVSLDYIFGLEDEIGGRVSSSSAIPSSVYSETERELIEAFRKLPSDSRALVLRMVGVEGSSSVSRKKA